MEALHHVSGRAAGEAIPDSLAIPACSDDAIAAEQREVLGGGRIADAQEVGELPDGFLTTDELTKDQEPVPIGQCLQQIARLVDRSAHGIRIDGCLYIHNCEY